MRQLSFDATRVVMLLRNTLPDAQLQEGLQQLAAAEEAFDEDAALAERDTEQRIRRHERSG